MSDFSQRKKCKKCGIVFCPDDGGSPCDCYPIKREYIVNAQILVEAYDEDEAWEEAIKTPIQKWDRSDIEEN